MDVAGSGVIFGCDIARFGGDETAIALRAGTRVLSITTWSKFDLMETCGRIVNLEREYHPVALHVDEIGLGGGVVDRLRELRLPVIGINVGLAARDPEKFLNLRAEYFHGLATRFRDGEIDIPPDDLLVGQLASIRYRYDSRGRMLIESKEDAAKRGVPSPDRAESVMLAFARPVLQPKVAPFALIQGAVRGWTP